MSSAVHMCIKVRAPAPARLSPGQAFSSLLAGHPSSQLGRECLGKYLLTADLVLVAAAAMLIVALATHPRVVELRTRVMWPGLNQPAASHAATK